MATTRHQTGQDQILSGLTAAQSEAVTHLDGPLLILAGPGSGKTRVVTHRIAHLLSQGIEDQHILALTFTNKAADEMRARLERLVGQTQVWTGTYHGFCARLLRRHAPRVGLRENYSIYDPEDAAVLLMKAIEELGLTVARAATRSLVTAISRAKNEVITPDEYRPPPMSTIGPLVARVYPAYQHLLLAANAVDFDDLLLHTAVLLKQNRDVRAALDARFRYIMVDEYQDTNFAQYLIVRSLSNDYSNLAVTGDPDQSIYGWRGANVRNIMEFEKDFPNVRVVRLEQNYRSTKRILSAADALIGNNAFRKQKQLFTENSEGMRVRLVSYPSGRDEAQAIAARIANEVASGQRRARDYSIFYRMNALSRGCEQALRSVGLPYQIVRGLEFYKRKEVKDILAYLHLLNNPTNDVALLRVINTPARGIGKRTIDRLTKHAHSQAMPLLEAARESGLIESLSKRTAVQVAKFVAMYDGLRARATDQVKQIVEAVMEATDYRAALEASGLEQDEQRLANLDELVSDAHEFDETHPEDGGLEAFLEQTSLVADVDGWAEQADCVTLMTLHAAKGLEFPVVFIIAIEEGVLPHKRAEDDGRQLEEERRLLFVGMTRAEQELHLSYAVQRYTHGSENINAPSQFLMELPRSELEFVGAEPPADGLSFDAEIEWDMGEDDEYVDRRSRPGGSRRAKRPPTMPRRLAVQTAAQMLGQANDGSARVSPDTFQVNMVVRHPTYGLGRILALDGAGRKRKATVQFVETSEPITFSLIHSPLCPSGSAGP